MEIRNYPSVNSAFPVSDIPDYKVEIIQQEQLINKIKCDLTEVKQILISLIDKNSTKGL